MNTWSRRANAMMIVGGFALLCIVAVTGFTVSNDGGLHCGNADSTHEVIAYEFSPLPLGAQCMYDGPEGEIVTNVDLATLPAVLALGVLVAGVAIRIRQD